MTDEPADDEVYVLTPELLGLDPYILIKAERDDQDGYSLVLTAGGGFYDVDMVREALEEVLAGMSAAAGEDVAGK